MAILHCVFYKRTSCPLFRPSRFAPAEDEWVRITYASNNRRRIRPLCSFKMFDFGELFGAHGVRAYLHSQSDFEHHHYDYILQFKYVFIIICIARSLWRTHFGPFHHSLYDYERKWMIVSRRNEICVRMEGRGGYEKKMRKTCNIRLIVNRASSRENTSRNKCTEKLFTIYNLIINDLIG